MVVNEMASNYGKDFVLCVQVFGKLSITLNGNPIILSKSSGSKLEHLFLLLLYREEGIERKELCRILYGDMDAQKAGNSLIALVFRLRKGLIDNGLPEGEYIVFKKNIYRWESINVKVDVDIEHFTHNLQIALEKTDVEEQLEYLVQLEALYQGEMAVLFSEEEWVIDLKRRMQEQYFICMRKIIVLYKEKQEYDKALKYCEKILNIYAHEEWQIQKIDILIEVKQFTEALSFYEKVVSFNRDQFGVGPSVSLKEKKELIIKNLQNGVMDIDDIQKSILNAGMRRGEKYCDYRSFAEIYSYMTRVLQRNGQSAYLLHYTIEDSNYFSYENDDVLEQIKDNLGDAIENTIRLVDIYTIFGNNHFLILLVGTDYTGGEIANRRIRKRFGESNTFRKITITHKLSSILDIKSDNHTRGVDLEKMRWNA